MRLGLILGCIFWVIVAFFMESAQAEETDLRIGLLCCSYHYDDDEDYNEENPGAFIAVDGWTLAAFENSYEETSVMFGYEEYVTDNFGLFVGVASGYGDTDAAMFESDFTIVAALTFRFGPVKPLVTPKVSALALEFDL